MKLVKGIYLPDYDTHFETVIDKEGNYQKKQFDAVMKYIKPEDRGLFIDVGAHVGLWSRMAIKEGFKDLLCFEPNTESWECLKENLQSVLPINKWGARCEKFALSDEDGYAVFSKDKEDNSGAVSLIKINANEGIRMIPFDSAYFPFEERIPSDLKNKTLIKIDVQGYEAKVVRGMTNFIKEYKPIIIVEQMCNDKWDLEATEYLKSLGMKVLEVIEKEVILGWEEK
jgi:FkbM family methyltransferase